MSNSSPKASQEGQNQSQANRSDSSESGVTFLVIATTDNWSRPFFVRAATLPDAYADVIRDRQFLRPNVKLEGYVIDLSMIPDVKDVARMYWDAGRDIMGKEQLAPSGTMEVTSFNDYWEEHGVSDEE